ncbi:MULTISPECIES: YihY/virulence factor BrkB family protein [Pedobacter]|uniref:Ribonuclease BN n=1 Tax=Pedobacter heparinus (strain ATCC 13125 / DSM 2366 / CIP 104194 / JCM 7457 / NBRC 12017 / NCIMB 9290 / NRRL B-14731 / HIM 762-3) TaxID=485917 RepID=C6Y433_PEDHD|nr:MULTISPECIES: YihY/virulence factor BrkB family protein [Pedobacter]ACU05476.1 ribonuclease BN [Pedobacter heparinus DSM 2366]MBB5440561.1 membrane protein [Pedobacter sp. AK017]
MEINLLQRTKLFFIRFSAAFRLFQKNDPLRLAGATAFFTNFALPPILLILIRLFGFFMDRKTLAARLFERLANILDDDSTGQIRQTLRNIRGIDHQWYATLISFVFFLFVATTLFNVIKNSMDQIWSIGKKEHVGFMFTMKLRARSMVIILLAGLLFLVGFLTDSIQAFIGAYINTAAPTFGKFFLSVLNQLLFIAIVMVWFTVLFRFLTNGRPTWKAALRGGILTAVLFTFGKYILRILLPLSGIGNVYGTSGSIVLIMLFVFYSSFIFYFGACYVKVLSDDKETPIRPIKGAYNYEIKEVIKGT